MSASTRYQRAKDTPEFKARRHKYYLQNKSNPKRKAQMLAATKRWQAKLTPEQQAAYKAKARLRSARSSKTRSPIKRRDYSLVQYLALLTHQDQRCAICKTAFDEIPHKRKRALDHDHKTSKIRGILCNSCNLLLGHAKDSPRILMAAINYLENI